MAIRTHTLVQFTDTHLTAGEPLYDAIDVAANLQRAVDNALESVANIDALVFTGDLANDGEPEAYRTIRSIAEPAAEQLGVPVIYGIGNHDERVAFRTELLDGAAAPQNAAAAPHATTGPDAPIDYVYELDGLRIVMLDSTIPGTHGGELTAEQIDWLNDQLDGTTPAIVTFHHPPFAWDETGPTAWMLSEASFGDRDPLNAALNDGGAAMVLSGHYHEPMTSQIGSVPVWAGGATAMSHEFTTNPMTIKFLPSILFSVIDVFDDGTAVARSVNALEREPISVLDIEAMREIMESHA